MGLFVVELPPLRWDCECRSREILRGRDELILIALDIIFKVRYNATQIRGAAAPRHGQL